MTLLVTHVLANHHDATVATNDFALVADFLHARLDLHGFFLGFELADSVLLVAVDDPAAREVVGRKLHDHSIVRKDPDVVHPHLPADVREHFVPVVQLHPEHCIGQ